MAPQGAAGGAACPASRDSVERLRESAHLLQGRVEDVLTFVRLADGQQRLDEEAVQTDIASVVRAAAAGVEAAASAKGLALHVKTPPDLVALTTYPASLTRLTRLLPRDS